MDHQEPEGPLSDAFGLRLFRTLDRLRAIWVHKWNLWRLRAAGVTLGGDLKLEGSVHVACGRSVTLGRGVRLGDGVYLGAWSRGRLDVGDHSYLGRGAMVLAYEKVTIGSHCLLAPYTYITDVNHGFVAGSPIHTQQYTSQPVSIGDGVWFGAGVKVLPGVTIGDGAVVGAGAVVTHDIPPHAVAAGVPAKVIRQRR